MGLCKKLLNTLYEVVFKVADVVLSLVGPFFGTLALCLLTFVTSVYFSELLPIIIAEDGTVKAVVCTIIGVWLLVNATFNHLAAMVFNLISCIPLIYLLIYFSFLDFFIYFLFLFCFLFHLFIIYLYLFIYLFIFIYLF
jgi:hypothetical protein